MELYLTRYSNGDIITIEPIIQKGGTMFFEIEGIAGSGKTTQCDLIKKVLENAHYSVTIANEPDMTQMGTHLRELLRSRVPRDALTEMFLLLANEAELHSAIIVPELAIPNHIILRDGGMGMFLSYAYLTTRLSIEALTYLFGRASKEHHSTETILLDVPPAIASHRLKERRVYSKFDVPSENSLKYQRDVLMHLAAVRSYWSVVDGTHSVTEVCNRILSRIRERAHANQL